MGNSHSYTTGRDFCSGSSTSGHGEKSDILQHCRMSHRPFGRKLAEYQIPAHTWSGGASQRVITRGGNTSARRALACTQTSNIMTPTGVCRRASTKTRMSVERYTLVAMRRVGFHMREHMRLGPTQKHVARMASTLPSCGPGASTCVR